MDCIYEYFEACKEAGLSGKEAMQQYKRDLAEYEDALIETLEERQAYTSYQQDLINLHRMER